VEVWVARSRGAVLREAQRLSVVDSLVLGWWAIAAGRMKPAMVKPVDVFEGGQLELVETAPRTVPLHQLVLYGPFTVSARALSYESPLLPTETEAPASTSRSV
jgi:hypothetical protein